MTAPKKLKSKKLDIRIIREAIKSSDEGAQKFKNLKLGA